MSEVKRFSEGPIGKGIYADPEGELCGFHHLERVTAERDALQVLLTAADERDDQRKELLRTSLIAMKRIYQAGYDRIIDAGGTCDTPEYMMDGDPTVREIRAALKPAEGGGDDWKSWAVGNTVRYQGSGQDGEDCYCRMRKGSDYLIHEAPDDHESMVVLDDDGDELCVLVGEFKWIKP